MGQDFPQWRAARRHDHTQRRHQPHLVSIVHTPRSRQGGGCAAATARLGGEGAPLLPPWPSPSAPPSPPRVTTLVPFPISPFELTASSAALVLLHTALPWCVHPHSFPRLAGCSSPATSGRIPTTAPSCRPPTPTTPRAPWRRPQRETTPLLPLYPPPPPLPLPLPPSSVSAGRCMDALLFLCVWDG